MPTPFALTKTANDSPPSCYGDPNIYDFMTLPVVAAASVPAASASLDGRMLIEDNGTGDRNIIFYAGGQRFRIDGGSAV